MPEYIKRDDAIQAKCENLNPVNGAYADGWNDCNEMFIDNLLSIPAADVHPVVHCCECGKYSPACPGIDERMICHKFALHTTPEFYCAAGIPRDDSFQEDLYIFQRQDDFNDAVKPIHDWLKKYGHPHMTVVIDLRAAEASEGIVTTRFEVE